MKFLEYTPFTRINGFLSNLDLGDCRLKGVLEAYSCKLAGTDKKLSRSIEQEVLDSLEMSPQNLSSSPVGPLSSLSSRRTLIHLILTLSHMYPDYDFSTLRAHHFSKENPLGVKESIGYHLLEATRVWASELGNSSLLIDAIWEVIDEVIDIKDCDIYSFSPEFQVGPFNDGGMIWSFNYFFYNKKLKRVLYFSCQSVSKLAADESLDNEADTDEDDFIQGMEIE
ncbi:repressor of RNA polymerase III transcription MAF1 homolog [Selaginella moellendorffii]|uniref:repressor of RNA polymerase III transcription MAF1 homolog n=1 Tax=Selaginella moellendorffii TaxID=88036 RepID=UPI000D1C5D6F|nr:repressor of RNA polymerase III transcription MAF1 homolog [Selaginella moellendorffii]|eukprot:XP_024514922.1 repressor of RNA polymerase III transcription MAF1 homolog [Selaginella moellendorffii]